MWNLAAAYGSWRSKKFDTKTVGGIDSGKNSIISFYEVGDRISSPENIIKLATTLNVSADYLLGLGKGESLDVTGLEEEDKMLIRSLVDTLRKRTQNSTANVLRRCFYM